MTIREEIIMNLDVPRPFIEIGQWSHYENLKSCIILYNSTGNESEQLDNWFSGIIQSLYYKPNHTFLILKGKDERLSDFFRLLLPAGQSYEGAVYQSDTSELYYELTEKTIPNGVLFNFLIGCFKCPEKIHLDLCEKDDFAAWTPEDAQMFYDGTPKPVCDKRLLSYCGVTEHWNNPPRKNVTVLEIESIDWEKFNSIPKLQLWQEIFNKFKL